MDLTMQRLIAKLPTIAAFAYRKSRGYPLMYPDNSLGYSANFVYDVRSADRAVCR